MALLSSISTTRFFALNQTLTQVAPCPPALSRLFSGQPHGRTTPLPLCATPSSPTPTSGRSHHNRLGWPRMASATAANTAKSLHDFSVKDIDGKDVDLGSYQGKSLLIVNVASECGLAKSNYPEMNNLYDKFRGQGFEILAFPCNQFGGQEPGSNEQIKEFAVSKYKAEFPIFDKVDVNGDDAAPIYKFLKANRTGGILGGLLGDDIKWNFAKFLVDKNGQVVHQYLPTTSPLSIEGDIEKLMAT